MYNSGNNNGQRTDNLESDFWLSNKLVVFTKSSESNLSTPSENEKNRINNFCDHFSLQSHLTFTYPN